MWILSLSFGVIDIVDVFVCFDEVNRKFSQWCGNGIAKYMSWLRFERLVDVSNSRS